MCTLQSYPMCTRKLEEMSGESPSPKRPAGRTKFHETRHPVFRGVRRRGRRGRWVCEVRVPGRRGCRLWLGTFDEPDTAARAHDAAMLALRAGAAAACRLNFADSAWLLAVPPPPAAAAFRSAADVQRAVAQAVHDFEISRNGDVAEDAMSATSEPSSNNDDDDDDTVNATSCSSMSEDDDEVASPFEVDDVVSDMGWSLYYASLAQGLLMEPPVSDDDDTGGDDGSCEIADVSLWSY